MRLWQSLAIALLASAGLSGAAFAQNNPAQNSEHFAPTAQDVVIDGVHAACDGVGLDERDNPQWNDYSLRISFVGDKGQFLGNEQITISGEGHNVSLRCEGPWALFKLPRGVYHVAADVEDAGHRDLTAHVGSKGQTHIVVRFPQAGGQVASNIP